MISSATGWFYSLRKWSWFPADLYRRPGSTGCGQVQNGHLPPGTDHEAFSPEWRTKGYMDRFGGGRDTLKLLYTGRISREKDLDVLAEAFLKVREEFPGVELFMAGDGPYMRELGKLLLGRGGSSAGTFPGRTFPGFAHPVISSYSPQPRTPMAIPSWKPRLRDYPAWLPTGAVPRRSSFPKNLAWWSPAGIQMPSQELS